MKTPHLSGPDDPRGASTHKRISRTRQILIRVDETEKSALAAVASERGVSISELIRALPTILRADQGLGRESLLLRCALAIEAMREDLHSSTAYRPILRRLAEVQGLIANHARLKEQTRPKRADQGEPIAWTERPRAASSHVNAPAAQPLTVRRHEDRAKGACDDR